MKKFGLILSFLCISAFSFSQGYLSGDFMLNASFYDRDDLIGTNTTQYLRELSSAESWLFLNYRMETFSATVRFDAFHNTPLFNPQEAFSQQGIGFFQLKKEIGDLEITGGYFYDQIGSGMIFRAFEDRTLGLDYAIQGVRLKYNFSETFRAWGFTGRQKYRLEVLDPIVKGVNIEKDLFINDNLQLFPGFGAINRTLPKDEMDVIADEIRTYDYVDRFLPKYNMYSFTFYNQLNYKRFGWYMEYALKTQEAIRNQEGDKLINRDGYALYSAFNYSINRLGMSLQFRKNQDFVLRTSPNTSIFEGVLNYLPPISKQHSLRLPARYSPAIQVYGEEGYQFEITYSINHDNSILVNLSYVNDGRDNRLFSIPAVAFNELTTHEDSTPAIKLYHEVYMEYYRKWNNNLKTLAGIQWLNYNREVYQFKPGVHMLESISPFAEVTYKLSRKKTIRTELQYIFTEQDMGDFAFVLIEFTKAPHYSVSVSDMINMEPREDGKLKSDGKLIHYPTIFASYTHQSTRVSAGYVKQVQGIVCTGGICRVEPAFSGVRLTLTTNF